MSDHLALAEAARLVALWRLAAGAAHATNNALTSILGEASYLRDEWKADPQIVDCCETIMAEVERCARLTRALLARRQPCQAGSEVDLGRLLLELREILPDALGRRYELHVEPGSELRVVAGRADALELLVLGLVQTACSLAGETARLDLVLEAGPSPGRAQLRLGVEASGLCADAAEGLRDPDRVADPALRTLLLAAHETVADLGARLACTGEPGRLEATVELPLVPDLQEA